MAHQQRMRALPLESGGAQSVNRRGLVVAGRAENRARRIRGKDTQCESKQRTGHTWLIRVRQQDETVWLVAASLAQTEPAAHQWPALMDECGAGRLDHR